MIKARGHTTVLLLSALLAQVVGAVPMELSFEEAVRMAQDKPAGVVMSHERVQQAVARLSQARTALLPQVTASASEQRRTANLEAQGINFPGINPKVGPFNTFDARLKLTQELFDAETLEALRYARTGQALAIEQKRKQQEDTMALVATLYVEAKRAQDNIALGESLKDRDTRESGLANKQVKLGTGAQTDADDTEARLADSQRYLTAAQAQAEERRLDLIQALDLPVDQAIVYKDTPQLPPAENTDQIIAADLNSHPDVAIARETLEERQASENVIKAGYSPKITAEGDYGASGKLPSDSFGTYNFGGTLSIPIFEGGNRQKRVQEAEHQVQESRVSLDDVKIQTKGRALHAAQDIKRTWASVEAAKSALDDQNKKLALARHRSAIGVGTDIELTEQQTRTAQARDDYQEALAANQMARVTLAQALGHMESLVNKQ